MAESDGLKFAIDGREYPIPSIESFNMNESINLYGYSNLSIDEVILDKQSMKHPGVMAALVHVAIRRCEPDMRDRDVREIVEAINHIDLVTKFTVGWQEDEKAVPPVQPPEDTSGSSSESTASSGDASSPGSDGPSSSQSPTGTPE